MADTNAWLSSLFGGAGSLAGSALTGILSSHAADKSFARTKELMALQQQYSLENWNRENAYNSPAAQMARLKAAGLNPNLVYGSGSAGVSGVAGSIPTPQAAGAPVSSVPDFSSAVGNAVNAAVGIAQAKKAGSEVIQKDIENKYLAEQLSANLASTKAFTELTNEQKALVTNQCADLSAKWNIMHKQGELLDKDLELKDKELKIFDRRMNAEIDYMIEQTNMTKAEREFLIQNKDNLLKLCKGQADLATTTANLANKYGDAQMVVAIISQVISAGADLLGSLPGLSKLLGKNAPDLLTGKTTTYSAGGKHETYHYGK